MLGFTIPPNTIGPDLKLPHYGTIVIHNNARIGSNARINVDVVIGENNGPDNVPIIGNNVVIEAGAKIYGKILIADDIHIGANSVVNKSFIEPNCVIAGIPAKVIKSFK
jgi:serine O-acetyltransferase